MSYKLRLVTEGYGTSFGQMSALHVACWQAHVQEQNNLKEAGNACTAHHMTT